MFPTSIYAELTPNPNTMKFVSDRVIFDSNDPIEYKQASEAKGSSILASKLFEFPFVKGVFIARNFVTVAKTADLSWDLITFELREFITSFLVKNETAVEQIPNLEIAAAKIIPSNSEPVEPSEFDEAIKNLLNEYVKPAVERDGGAIDFVSFKDGIVKVQLRGSCSGCPSSTVTLKDGIETLLTSELPVVKSVEAESV